MENLRPNGQRAQNAIILIWIMVLLEVFSLLSSYLQYILLQGIANGEEISIDALNSNDLREQAIAIAYVCFTVISAITFIQWFRRAYFNLHQRASFLSYSEGWAAGCWFVPFINLVRPYRIMTQLYEVTNSLGANNKLENSSQISTNFLGFWWTLWILNNFVGQFVFRYSMRAETIEELTSCTLASMVANIIGIPLALITIKIIKDYSSIEPLISKKIVLENN